MSFSRIIVVLLLALGACDPGTGASQDASPQDSELVEAGEELYRANCSVCHGVDLTGSSTGPSLLSDVYHPDRYSDVAFTRSVELGSSSINWDFGPMPRIEGLSQSDVEAIIAYVRENQRVRGFEPYPPS